jgi:uncharacterized protein (TIGR02996 family)
MTERDALLRAVCENPDDDTPRLVYADWLQENGEEARAEFIRVQVTMARTKDSAQEDWPNWQQLCAREQELLLAHDEDWWRELPDAPGYRLGRLFTRGFVDVVFVTEWEPFARDIDTILAAAPVTGVSVRCHVAIAQPVVLGILSRFRTLGFDSSRDFTEADWTALIEAPLPKLERLSLPKPEWPLKYLCRQLEARFGPRLHDSRYSL